MKKSETIAQLAAALAEAQKELKNPALDGKADIKSAKGSYGYRYATLPAILDAVRPVFARHGLAVLQWPMTGKTGPALGVLLLHASGEWIEPDPLEMPVGQQGNPQAVGSTITYARRYVLAAIAGVVGEDDDDAQAAMRPARKEDRKEPPPATGVYLKILNTERTMCEQGLCIKGELRRHLRATIGASDELGLSEVPMSQWPEEVYPAVVEAVKAFAAPRKAQQPKAA